MVSRRLMAVWGVIDFALLAAGAIALALSMVWRKADVLMNMVLSKSDLTAGTVLGIALLVTFAISIFAVVQQNHITIGLVILNYALLADAIIILVVGTFVWYYTLEIRANFHEEWFKATAADRVFLQDKFQCCGYFNVTDLPEIGGSYCVSQDFINGLNATIESNVCVGPITKFADYTLNNVFTTIYGYMAIVLCLLLATLCVINKRKEDERFRKIDAKRGGRGFV